MKMLIVGGQYGSEGKGCVAEYVARNRAPGGKLVAFAESGPNSGHTNTLWCTHVLPSCALFADIVVIGPDAVINVQQLAEEVERLPAHCQVYVHANAAVCNDSCATAEREAGLEDQLASTCTGSGVARYRKYILRKVASRVVKWTMPARVTLVGANEWMRMVDDLAQYDWIAEGSQGALLDTNFGFFPYVTSRSTLPLSIIGRNGLAGLQWQVCAVYRPYPIRTGGPSGPCYGPEITWESLGVPPEIASTTKRVRRVFDWSQSEFEYSLQLTKPDVLAFTHMDYVKDADEWLAKLCLQVRPRFTGPIWASSQPASFKAWPCI